MIHVDPIGSATLLTGNDENWFPQNRKAMGSERYRRSIQTGH
jgi:hypothetical protein